VEIINLKDTIFRPGEYIVGADQTHSHACYLLYGILNPAEDRTISPGRGHEEIFCCLEGSIVVNMDGEQNEVQKGQCFHLNGEDSVDVSNEGQGIVIYVLAGGHSQGSDHHGHSHQGEGHSH